MVLSEAGSGGGGVAVDDAVAALWRRGRSCGGVFAGFLAACVMRASAGVRDSSQQAVNILAVISAALNPQAFRCD
jgi:hypothetical protein